MNDIMSSDTNLCCGLCGRYYEGKQEVCFDDKPCVYISVQLIQSDVLRRVQDTKRERREVTLTWVALKALDILNRHEEAAKAMPEFFTARHRNQAQEAIKALAAKSSYSCDEVHAEINRLNEAV